MKRFTALFLTLAMLLSLFPTTVWAEEQMYTDDQVYVAAEETEGIPEEDLMPTEEPIPSEVESTPAEEESTLVEETLSTEEPEDSEEEETVVMTETITVSSPAANAAATVEARWGKARSGGNAPYSDNWEGSGTLAAAMEYANNLSSGTAYIQLRSNVTTSATLVFDSGKTTVLDLYSYTINRGGVNSKVITVNGTLTITGRTGGQITGGSTGVHVDGGTLAMNGGAITGNTDGGVYLGGASSFVMNGGTISENTRYHSAGVAIYGSGSTFVMNGGTISGNTANEWGGAVYVYGSGASFTMNDGTISGNTARIKGGGVYVSSSGTFTMAGGTISGNTAKYGGGVYAYKNGVFTMSGGTISGNTATISGGGFSGYEGSAISVSGKAKISGNKLGTADNNVELYNSSHRITVGTLSSGAEIGITLPDGTGTFTSGGSSYAKSDYFFSDNTAYAVYADGSNLKLATAPTTVTISFNKNGGTGSMSSQTVSYNTATTLRTNAFTRTGYAFTGWNTKADGSGTAYADKASITARSNTTLYAQWKETHSHPNCGAANCTNTSHGHTNVTSWTKLTSVGSTLSDGSYYLGEDITVSSTITISGTVNLCLNGNTLALASGQNGSVLQIETGATLNLCDCSTPSTGIITGGNVANNGGGINVGYGNLVMYGGTISGNKAGGQGGGVFVNGGTFSMYGGRITNNSANNNAGGVYLSNCTFSISGAPVISSNTSGSGSLVNADNVYVYNYYSGGGVGNIAAITVGTLTDGANIGVTLASCPGFVTIGGAEYVDDGYFFSDNTNYEVAVDGDNLMLARMATITFNANGGSGTMNPQKFAESWDEVTLNANTFTRQGYAFTGWNTKADGTGTTVPDAYTIPPFSGSVTFYAQWVATHSHPTCGVAGCTNTTHGHSAVDTWTELTSADLVNGTLRLSDGMSYYLGEDITVSSTITISGTVNLCLNGNTLALASGQNGSVLQIGTGATLNLCDCSTPSTGIITGGYVTGDGGGVYVAGGTFTMNGGTISGNTSKDTGAVPGHFHGGGGVFVCYNGTFTMNGGIISGNSADNFGGGVHAADDGTFIMTGGTISDNTANGGGGVSVSGTFTMSGGEIWSNTASSGGGVYVYDGTFTMSGGEIYANGAIYSGGGVYVGRSFTMTGGTITGNAGSGVYCTGKMTVSGSPYITGNNGSNVYLYNNDIPGYVITVGTLTSGANIGVTLRTGTGTFTSGGAEYANSGYFFSDDDFYYEIAVDGDNLKLIAKEVTITFDANGGSGTMAPQTVEKGSEVTLNANTFTREGYKFVGWNGAADGSVGGTVGDKASFTVLDDMTLYAQWKHSHPNCGVVDCTNSSHGHSAVTNWIELTSANLNSNGTLSLTDGNSYYLGEDITVTDAVRITGAVNLCLNGNTLKNESGKAIESYYGTSVVVCDCSGNNAGTISGGSVGIWANESNTKVTLYGGSVSGGRGVALSSRASYSALTVYGGVVTATNEAIELLNVHNMLTVNGGIISGKYGIYAPNAYASSQMSNCNEIHVTGGTITGTNGAAVYTGCDTYISGGTLNGTTYGISASGSGISLSGAPAISGTTGDIELDGSQITVNGALSNTTPIGITMATPGVFAKPDGTNVTSLSSYAGKFTSDDDAYEVAVDGNNLKLAAIEARWGLANGTEAPTEWVGSGTWENAVSYANMLPSGTAYIQFLSDVTLTYGPAFIRDKTTILDLNGKTLNRGLTASSEENDYALGVYGNLTLCDSSSTDVSKQGKITGGKNSTQGSSDTSICGGGVYVSSTGTFTMTGGNITGNIAYQGGGVFSRGNFTMTGGAISNCTASFSGGGVYVSGTFTMNSGTISDNTTAIGGGGVALMGDFTLNNGSISGNTAAYGGGVDVEGGVFTMNGGTISDNTTAIGGSSNGGGVCVYDNGIFTMNGGTISNNTAAYGGGVYLNNNHLGMMTGGTFAMTGGTISDNATTFGVGGGVYVGDVMQLSGNSNISGNKRGTDSSAIVDNVYLKNNMSGTITVNGALSNTTPIGVTMATSGVFAKPDGTNVTSLNSYAGKFTSDDATYEVAADGNNLKLVEKVVTYTVSFDKNGGTGTMADVTGVSGEYTLPDCGFTAPSGKYFFGWATSSEGPVIGTATTTVTANTTLYAIWENIPAVAPTVTPSENLTLTYKGYSNKQVSVTVAEQDDYTYTYQWHDADGAISGATGAAYTIPNDLVVGTYSYSCVVTATRKDNGLTATTTSAAITVKVEKATPTVTAPTGLKATYGQTLANVMLPSGWAWKDATTTSVGNAGNNTFTVVYTHADTDNYNTVEKQVTVEVAKQKVAKPTDDNTVFTYTGVAQTYSVADSTLYEISNETQTNAGSYTVIVALKKPANYEWADGTTDNLTFTFTIGKAPLTVKARDIIIYYGDTPDPNSMGVEYSGFVNGENGLVLGGSLSCNCDYERYDDVGEYDIIPAGLEYDNYAITFVKGTLKVLQRIVNVHWSNTSLIYNGTAQAPTAILLPTTDRDFITPIVEGAQTDVGSYTATVTGVAGEKAYNYTVDGVPTEFTIAPKAMDKTAITLSATAFVYTGEQQKPVVTVTDGETVLVENTDYTLSWAADCKNVGEHFVFVTFRGNYNGTEKLTFAITKADQTAPAVGKVDETISKKSDGMITSVDSTMEYSTDGSSYTAISGDKLENLAAGTYYVRLKGDDNHNPSPATSVEIAVGRKLKVTFVADGVIIDTVYVDYGADATAPEIPDKEGYTQIAPIWDADGKNITTDTEINAVYTINKYTIGGTITSFLDAAADVTIELWVEGAASATYTTTVTGNSAPYSFSDLVAGTYTMKVSKANHVTREYTVTVGSADVTQDAKICPRGDADCNGKVNIRDWNAVKAHNNETTLLTGYEFSCADTDGNGKVNIRDWNALKAHINETKFLW